MKKVRCSKNNFHTVVFYQYNSFSYHYCKQCKCEINSFNPKSAYSLEMELNNKLLNFLGEGPNVVFPEYFMVKEENGIFTLIIIDRIDQKEISFSEISKVTLPYLDKVLKEYETEQNIVFNFK